MSNPPPPASSPDTPKWTRDPAHTTSSTARRSGASERLRIVRNLLIATENNRAASENNLRASENTVRAAEKGIQAADRTMEAAKEVVRVADHAEQTEDDAGLASPADPPRSEEDLHKDEFTAPRSLEPDNVPVPLPEPRRVRNSLSRFGILERLVLVVSVAGITAFFMVVMPPGTWNLGTNQRTADTNSPDSQSPAQPAGSATTPTASPEPTPAAVDQATASSSSVRQIDHDEVIMLVKRGEEFVMAGDLVAARLMLQRAAEVGDPRASLALGGTYDPIHLEHLGVRGVFANVATARAWYEKAKRFGSAEAPRRLELLAKRDP